jgi:uncharacterized protein (UPF0333 family)
MKRRGQAAMEFLMTYGWAILAAIIVIGVLAIYFRPSTLQGSSAYLTAPLYADAWNVDATTDAVNLDITNNFGEIVTITSITVTGTGDSLGTDCTSTGLTTNIAAGATIAFPVGAGCLFSPGDRYSGDIAVRYTRDSTGAGTPLTSTGTISDTAV